MLTITAEAPNLWSLSPGTEDKEWAIDDEGRAEANEGLAADDEGRAADSKGLAVEGKEWVVDGNSWEVKTLMVDSYCMYKESVITVQ